MHLLRRERHARHAPLSVHMTPCALCRLPTEHPSLSAGLPVCAACLQADPTPALRAQGLDIAHELRLGGFNANVALGVDAGFRLVCTPEHLLHKAAKWVVSEVQVGVPRFDDAVWVQTSDKARAQTILGDAGVQSALLILLADLRPNELTGQDVRLDGANLVVRLRPLGELDAQRVADYLVETAALALRVRGLLANPA
jgi:hypothetical protein